MIAIVAKSDPLSAAFYSDFSESETLLLFSRLYGIMDVIILESSPLSTNGALDSWIYKKSISKNKFKRFVSSFTPFAESS